MIPLYQLLEVLYNNSIVIQISTFEDFQTSHVQKNKEGMIDYVILDLSDRLVYPGFFDQNVKSIIRAPE